MTYTRQPAPRVCRLTRSFSGWWSPSGHYLSLLTSRTVVVLLFMIYAPLGHTSASASQESAESILNVWTAGLDALSPEEGEYLKGLAQERLNAPQTKGFGPPPGVKSEIIREPFFFNYVVYLRKQGKDMDPKAKTLIAEQGDRFYYFETGVTIEKEQFESIDALIFEL